MRERRTLGSVSAKAERLVPTRSHMRGPWNQGRSRMRRKTSVSTSPRFGANASAISWTKPHQTAEFRVFQEAANYCCNLKCCPEFLRKS